MKNMNEITSEQVLYWAYRVEAQRAQKALMETKKIIKNSMLKNEWAKEHQRQKRNT